MPVETLTGPNPSGLCLCGCGAKTRIAKYTHKNGGDVAGHPVRYLKGHHGRRPLAQRLADHTEALPNGCVEWTGAKYPDGYGVINVNGSHVAAHRVMYELAVGPIPSGLQLDHLCRNRACVNPAHLEPVTQAENIRRGVEARTHCKHGHPRSEENTYTNPTTGHKRCRVCQRENQRRNWQAA